MQGAEPPRPGALRAGCLNFIELSAISVANIAPKLTTVRINPPMHGPTGNGSLQRAIGY